MKKAIIILVALISVLSVKAQTSSVFNPKDTTATYNNRTYKKGQLITMGYGSGANKDFKYIEAKNWGKFEGGAGVLGAEYAKYKFNINNITVNGYGQITLWAKPDWIQYVKNKDGDFIALGEKELKWTALSLILETAVDNKEILEQPIEKQPVKKPASKKY
ncbi:MAG: hypothetical protein V4520_05300 [Bacteroidota bacterium]